MLDKKPLQPCLNPCFSGTYSRSINPFSTAATPTSLNPCFSGTYSRRNDRGETIMNRQGVLILVLVEHTLGVFVSTITRDVRDVLILVLVEHTLGALSLIFQM